MLENTKNLFTNINDKQSFIMLCADEFGIKPISIRNNWFSGFWSIPDKHQERVLVLLQNYIKHQTFKTVSSCL